MTQSMLTSAIAFDGGKADAVDRLLEDLRPGLFGSGSVIRAALRGKAIHFLSITTVRGDAGEPTHLVIEVSGDGAADAVYESVATNLEPWLRRIFETAGVPDEATPLKTRLVRARVKTGQGLFETAGLDFCGAPNMTVERILLEGKLADWLRGDLDENPPEGTALTVLKRMHEAIKADNVLSPLLTAEAVNKIPDDEGKSLPPAFILCLVAKAIAKFLWPVLLLLALLVGAATYGAFRAGTAVGLLTLVVSLMIATGLLIAVFVGLYLALRAAEAANAPIDTMVDPVVMAAVARSETGKETQQNHLAGISVMQAGPLRELTLRFAFWVIGQLAAHRFRPGYLGDIGTIHFARWLRLPKTNKLLFFSNYGGSWESYLEDFITKAASGLTGAWSNTLGFPRTENLFLKGATDGDRFKRWARRQQRPTWFWYSAYPHLTTARIRTNAAIRQGLAKIETEDEAVAWLGLFGSTIRPASLIETSEVQTLLYGGLSKHRFAACLAIALPGDPVAARQWLGALLPRVSFGDQPPDDKVLVLALSAPGLEKLGAPGEILAGFPTAYRVGMCSEGKAGVLGDTGEDDAKHWLWGGPAAPADAALLVYADDDNTLEGEIDDLERELVTAGGQVIHRVTPEPLPARNGQPGSKVAYEPFGFADGVSQPIIKGTRRWLRQSDAIHTVEPGEFLLGYPDSRGEFPPSPTVDPSLDRQNVLPLAGKPQTRGLLFPDFERPEIPPLRDFGRNGSFMVIRQLAQNVELFKGFLKDAAERYADHPAMPRALPDELREEWIGAKMVGRWKDGSSLVRFPHGPATANGHDPARFRPDNEFLFGAEDPLGERCPLGSHIRRSNPRDSKRPGSADELSIVNRHRILRLGRKYDAAGGGETLPKNQKPGLLFVCLNADIERQFEFIQQTWAMTWQFHGLANEVDPIIGRGEKLGRLTIPSSDGPLHLTGVKDFVTVRGGGYFFMPSRSALRFLAGLAQ